MFELPRTVWPFVRLGLEVSRGADGALIARALALRSGRVVWQKMARLRNDRPASTELAEFLATAPHRWWHRRHVVAALGPSFVQIKRLAGLPPLSDALAASAAVRANSDRFFLRNGIPIVTSAVRVDADGAMWGAATEQPILAALEAACRSTGLHLDFVIPAATGLGAALDSDTTQPPVVSGHSDAESGVRSCMLEWEEGGAFYEFTYAGSRLIACQRRRPHAASTGNLGSASFGGGRVTDVSFAAAYGAAIARRRAAIVWHPIGGVGKLSLADLRLTAFVATLAVTAALVVPPIADLDAGALARGHSRAAAVRRADAIRTIDSLDSVMGELRNAATFLTQRHSVTQTLAGITSALPPRTALLNVHIDTAGGTLIAVTPSAGPLLSALERSTGLGSLELIGPVTSESLESATQGTPTANASVSNQTLSRVTVRFRFASRRTARDTNPKLADSR